MFVSKKKKSPILFFLTAKIKSVCVEGTDAALQLCDKYCLQSVH